MNDQPRIQTGGAEYFNSDDGSPCSPPFSFPRTNLPCFYVASHHHHHLPSPQQFSNVDALREAALVEAESRDEVYLCMGLREALNPSLRLLACW